jgi:hypothetical protein
MSVDGDKVSSMAKNKNNDDEFEPGAAQFGNFINYYEFNPPKNRLALFEGKFCECFSSDKRKILCLDVGCNTGVSFSVLTLTVQFLFMFFVIVVNSSKLPFSW